LTPHSVLIEKISPVKRVALFGNEAGVTDDVAEIFFRGGESGARLRHHILLDHDTADIVAAEAEAGLTNLQTLGHPGGLHVYYVIQIKAGDGECLKKLHASSFLFDEAAERSVIALKTPRYERGESAGFIL